ncbi:MAG: hypothetical protein FWF54_03310 [Candidatus Azobacteroides sp.]|nr:hypothetical protein [Candidatus Azobacteroides sp.]
MTKIICKKIEYVFLHGVKFMYENTVTLKQGYAFATILTQNKPVYKCELSKTDAGELMEEIIEFETKYNEKEGLMLYSYLSVIIRYHTDKGIYILGNTEYPAKITYSHDRVKINYSVTSKSVPGYSNF